MARVSPSSRLNLPLPAGVREWVAVQGGVGSGVGVGRQKPLISIHKSPHTSAEHQASLGAEGPHSLKNVLNK